MFGRLNDSVAALTAVGSELLAGRLIGLEKESLRVSIAGTLSQRDHPTALGSALTHPNITTDFGEAMLEFVTPPFADSRDTISFLDDLHRFTARRLDGERLWAASMPCVLDGERSIRIGEYGSSNAGTMKHVYRKGLGLRYGKSMQVISGIHVNLSWPEAVWSALAGQEGAATADSQFVSERYLHTLRNVQRYGWLLLYLFGASPALCTSFLNGQTNGLDRWDDNTVYRPFGTSLRMSDLGYRNSDKAPVRADYNSLDGYVASLRSAIQTSWPAYQQLGQQSGEQWTQLNTNMLQIENEYYSGTRPKQIADQLEKPSTALARRGVAYVELRTLDVNPFAPSGVDIETIQCIEAFALFCLLHDSAPFDSQERARIDQNNDAVANFGRDPSLQLADAHGLTRPLPDMANELLTAMATVAPLLGEAHTLAVDAQLDKVRDPSLTLSGRILSAMEAGKSGFYDFAMALSEQHDLQHRQQAVSDEREAQFQAAVEQSVVQQREIESGDNRSFEAFLADYMASE